MKGLIDWLGRHDPRWLALRRAGRTAIVMPLMFLLGDKTIANPTIALFAAFGSFAMLLLVDFAGPIRERLLAQASLAVTCGALISLATVVSQTTWLAAVGMAAAAFAVLFAGVVSSTLAGATTTLLLAFILPVSLPGPASSIPDRLAGWGMASGASLLAISLLWPAPARDPVRSAAIAACRAIAARLRSETAWVISGGAADETATHATAVEQATAAVGRLQTTFFATPFRPTGLSTGARAIVRLVDELRWLDGILKATEPNVAPPLRHGTERACAVRRAAAVTLDEAAALIDAPSHPPGDLRGAIDALRASLDDLENATTTALPPSAGGETDTASVVSALDPSFRAQEISYVTMQIARNADFAAAAERRTWLDRVLGRQPAGLAGTLTAAQERAGAHVERHSLWLHNSLRGAAGLGLAVLVADLFSVQHGFWVAFGTLSVLRSSALNTGANIVRAIAGTTVGFVVGAAIVYGLGTDTTTLWIMLPFAVLIAGLAPAAVSFEAGQAAFTLVLLILFNILAPTGWTIGVVRIEDVALGGGVSLLVGLLFWPRGAAAALGQALADAYDDSSRYLAAAVEFGVARCDSGKPAVPEPAEEATRAAAAARRLDDTFRGYLVERGAKPVPLAEITSLVTGVAGLRLAADAVLELWQSDRVDGGDRAAARRELEAENALVSRWYDGFAQSLAGARSVPEPLSADAAADGRLVAAVSQDLRTPDGNATATAVRMIWTGDHLDAARRLQTSLVDPARAAVDAHALR